MVFVGNIPFNQPNQNEQYVLLLLGQEVVEKEETIQSFIDLRNIFPRWLVEKGETTPPTTHIITFTQSYYDWLYNFSDYELIPGPFHSKKITNILDIDETPVEFLKHFIYTYAPGFPDFFINGQSGPIPQQDPVCSPNTSPGNVRSFIKNIRQGFYQRKSSEDAYRYFFREIYGQKSQDTEFFYPKADILRLNGGKFEGWTVIEEEGLTGHYGGVAEDIRFRINCPKDSEDLTSPYCTSVGPAVWHLGGSYLNGRYVIQDSNWYQDYSYVLKGYVDCTDEETGLPVYFDSLQEMLHPAGMKGFWEKTEADYIPPDDFGGGFNFCESPMLQNYFPYRMKDEASLPYCYGCSGSGHTYDGPTAMFYGLNNPISNIIGGLTGWTSGSAWNSIGHGGICIEGTTGSTFDAWGGKQSAFGSGFAFGVPTHFYPNWSLGISGDDDHSIPFEEIYIGEFISLCPLEDSPNLGLTGCTGHTKC